MKGALNDAASVQEEFVQKIRNLSSFFILFVFVVETSVMLLMLKLLKFPLFDIHHKTLDLLEMTEGNCRSTS